MTCLVTEGKIKGEMEVARRRGRRHKKLLYDLKDRRGYSHLKEEALDRTMWRHFLEDALDLSSDRILNECEYVCFQPYCMFWFVNPDD